jgi:N-carbamoylputrescine amidase
MDGKRKIRVAVLQTAGRLGKGTENLDAALPCLEAAARDGARLAVLPELSASGYRLSRELWACAERAGGPTETWLRRTAARLGMVIGAGYLEVEGEDFYNCYALAEPAGTIAGRVRKERPSMGETSLFAASEGSHVVETSLGRIGVGICNDNHMAFMPRRLREGRAELLVMPHAWPLPSRPGRLMSRADIDRQRARMLDLAAYYAGMLGIPAAMTNFAMGFDAGAERPRGLLASVLPDAAQYVFPGLATIADSDGRIAARLGGEPGWAAAEVLLDPARRTAGPLPAYGRRAYPDNGDGLFLSLAEAAGRRAYRRSRERREAASRRS